MTATQTTLAQILAVARDEALEEAAKVADAYTTPNESGHDGKCYCRGCMARHEIAAAIRKLKGASHA